VRTLTLLVISFFSSAISAGTVDKLRFFGFSADGKYMAYEKYGIRDGSGLPYSEIRFVDVKKNEYVPNSDITLSSEASSGAPSELADLREKAKARARERFLKLGIQNGNFLPIVTRLLTEISTSPKSAQFILDGERLSMPGGENPQYAIDIREAPAKANHCQETENKTPKLLEVVLTGLSPKRSFALQKDKQLPLSRQCPFGYDLRHVYLHEKSDALVVFVSYSTPGYEGPDVKFLSVTGVLPR